MSRVVVASHRTCWTVACLLALAGCPVNVDTSALKDMQQQTPQNQPQQSAANKPASSDAQDEGGDGDAAEQPAAHDDVPEMGGQHDDMPPPQELGDAGMDHAPPPRMCDEQVTSGCCGDEVCDGPETHDSCAADCDEGEVALPAPPPPDGGVPDGEQPPPEGQPPADGGMPPGNNQPPPGGGIPMCNDAQTTMCCGDTICGGPETHDNCAADCDVGEVALPPVGPH
jgi:hypothetical protein